MTVIINGTTGISGVDGSAGTPAVQGTDTNTGVFYPAADTVGVSTGGSERMRVDSSGNLLIGTTSSTVSGVATTGVVVSKTGAALFSLNNVSNTNQSWSHLIYDSGLGASGTYSIGQIVNGSSSGLAGGPYTPILNIAVPSAASNTAKVFIDASGNMGIGTTSPAYKLDVSGAATATPVTNGIIRILTTGSNPPTGYGGGLVFSQVDSASVNRDYASITGSRVDSSSDNRVDMVFSTGNPGASVPIAERMRLTTAGRLLVGTTTSPSNTGGVIVANNELFVYNIPTTASGANCTISSGEGNRFYRSTSALKYKQDIRDLEPININSFRPVRYKSKCENDDQTKDHFGFIADEAAAAGFEELVSRGVDGEVEGFQYDRMTVVLTAAIQEQQALITALTERITALENK